MLAKTRNHNSKKISIHQIIQCNLLVSFGAEWCIWCHVFQKYIYGEFGAYEYTAGEPSDPDQYTVTLYERAMSDVADEARALTTFVRDNFVLLHLESDRAEGADQILQKTGAIEGYTGFIPYVFTVDQEGNYVHSLDANEVEIRRDGVIDWYRGYDRDKLLNALSQMRVPGTGE